MTSDDERTDREEAKNHASRTSKHRAPTEIAKIIDPVDAAIEMVN